LLTNVVVAAHISCFRFRLRPGYTGADCSQKTSTSEELNYSPALLGLIITLFVVSILLVGLILFMFRQVNAYRQDASNYMALHGGDTDTGV
jgi:hypothetical protein